MMRLDLRLHNRIALWLFGAVWLVCAAMRVVELVNPPPPMVQVAAERGGAGPVVVSFADSSLAGRAPFEIGDRILAVDGVDVRGAGWLRFYTIREDAWWRADSAVSFDIERAGERRTVVARRPTSVLPKVLANFALSLSMALAAVILLVRARPTKGSTALFYSMGIYSLLYVAQWNGPGWAIPFSLTVAVIAALLSPVALVYGSLSFPEEAGSLRGWNYVWPWVFLGLGVLFLGVVFGVPVDSVTASELTLKVAIVWIVAQQVVFSVNYVRSSPAGRRQVKWVLLSAYLSALTAFGVFMVSGAAAFTNGAPRWVSYTMTFAGMLFPLSILIAMLRSDLFDIDRILGATLSYNLLGIVVVGGAFAIVPPLTGVLTASLDMDQSLSRTGITIALAALVIVAERRFRPLVDRMFFKERFALEQMLADVPERLASVRRAEEMWTLVGESIVAALRPQSCVVYLAADETFVPGFADADSVPAAIPARTALTTWIAGLAGATRVDARSAGLAAPGRALLKGLGARVIVPINRGGSLEAFLCIGEKRSGDIFTATDLTLLTSLGRTASSHLLRFDASELHERARVMQEKMRRYVPGAVAEMIALGEQMETGEREVSVLFVDIRGYTAFADGRAATDIFSTVNRYTETVSNIVRECGGVVVEFNGDGMMAVFGAPRPLAEKEASAVQAARRLVEAVPAIASVASDSPDAPALAVGVGVATGAAFVGNIEAVDRTIWSAIGSTTNLAARLQTLTRERGASVLIDATTHQRAGAAAREFVRHPDVTIRGRKALETLYGLPLKVSATV